MTLRAASYQAICDGHTTVAALAAHLHEPEERIRNAVCKLQRLGVVRRSPESVAPDPAVYEVCADYDSVSRPTTARAAVRALEQAWPMP